MQLSDQVLEQLISPLAPPLSETLSPRRYFGNLHAFVQQKSLEDLCAYFGQVESVKVIKAGHFSPFPACCKALILHLHHRTRPVAHVLDMALSASQSAAQLRQLSKP